MFDPIQLKNLLRATFNELLKPILERLDRIEAALKIAPNEKRKA